MLFRSHEVVLFTWGGFILVTLLGRVMQQKVSTARVISFSLISSLLFYLVSNFGVWFMGWYSRDLKGLVDCYIMGLPFLRNFTIATLSYAAILFGIYQIIAHYVKDTELAKVLLTK